MKKKILIGLFAILFLNTGCKQYQKENEMEQTIFVFGGDINLKFVEYTAELIKKENPKICYVPTASADNSDNIAYYKDICKRISIEPHVLNVWISSETTDKSFEDILLDMDAIIVGGGNTLNMLGIWQAQEIDKILKKALEKGIVLAGGSAGSICWFQNGISDSRPIFLSSVNGLGFLPYSHCPHYAQNERKELYHQFIKEKKMNAGYACDDLSGIVFKDGKIAEVVSQSDQHNSYYVSLKNDEVVIEKLESNYLVRKNALTETDYIVEEINKRISDFSKQTEVKSPLDAFVNLYQQKYSDKNTNQKKKDEINNITIDKVFTYNNLLAGVVNKMYDEYYMMYFYNKDNNWINAGEDIGGNTVFESEITFREKAKIIINYMAGK